jgi:serine/threonine-protein phosphatase Stp1
MAERALRLRDANLSHPGKVRAVNEDAVFADLRDGLWAVADGMGGHANGQWAAQQIVQSLAQAPPAGGFEARTRTVAEALATANARIWEQTLELGQSMGSTVTALLVHERRFAVFWAGDSRCYLLREGAIRRLTTDHSQVQAMVDAGRLTPEEAESHPMAHVLSRAVGVEPELQLDTVSGEAAAGDVFLLCSDGLSRVASDAEMAQALGAQPPAAAAEQLVALSLERGAPDNVSVVVVGCSEATLLAFG